ncbi:superoxide dismutase family protein [Marinobacter fonticola]|uniref:superoxide dismutase family protein n=1 Tax=Marinobacter fonticola TaxID=2603215 RepID=UPI0011E73759|nr:superoxide dismutase family protein [Marinobacter fonticola]
MLSFAGVLGLSQAQAQNLEGESIEVEMHKVSADGIGQSIGTITVRDHEDGVLFEPDLEGLETGLHGFHLHQNPNCEPAKKDGKMTAAASAGGHVNPSDGQHKGPYEEGHLGDLPALYVDDSGKVTVPVLAPRLDYGEVNDRALMIHSGGDNYSYEPEKLGGGGSRVACGVIQNGDE